MIVFAAQIVFAHQGLEQVRSSLHVALALRCVVLAKEGRGQEEREPNRAIERPPQRPEATIPRLLRPAASRRKTATHRTAILAPHVCGSPVPLRSSPASTPASEYENPTQFYVRPKGRGHLPRTHPAQPVSPAFRLPP